MNNYSFNEMKNLLLNNGFILIKREQKPLFSKPSVIYEVYIDESVFKPCDLFQTPENMISLFESFEITNVVNIILSLDRTLSLKEEGESKEEFIQKLADKCREFLSITRVFIE